MVPTLRLPRNTCPDNSTDNGGGVCDCDPGYVYTVPTGALYGPWRCTERTVALCGAAPDPGCGDGSTWNSGTAKCVCDDGYERSDDGGACVQYLAGVCARNLDGIPFAFGTVRHDDVQSYVRFEGGRFDERTSGFYAVSMVEAVAGAIVKSGVRRVGHATALLSSVTSMPSWNFTPSITLPSWRKPRSRRQDVSALMPIL